MKLSLHADLMTKPKLQMLRFVFRLVILQVSLSIRYIKSAQIVFNLKNLITGITNNTKEIL